MRETRETLSGLGAAAEIRVDRWGIPHIRASSEADLFFAQGFNAARDRLWQIDLWRKRGLGRLAASFGPGFLAQDRATRAFLYRGDMAEEWAAYGPGTEAVCSAFVAGINAFVGLVEAGQRPPPREFTLTDTAPERWEPADVVRIRTHALGRNAISELQRALILPSQGPETDLLRKNLEPRVVPDTSDAPSDPPRTLLDRFLLATAPATFPPERLSATLAEEERWTKVDDLAGVVADADWSGSNNWAVGPGRTASGRPVVAADPHRLHGLPSLRYLVHLTSPGLDVIGAGEPSAPGVSMGHNGFGAFTQTIFYIDQEDVVVCATDPADPELYAGPEGSERIERVAERFEVRGHGTLTRELAFTRHGPVLMEEPEKRRVWSLRTVWSEPGTAAYLGGLSTMRARSFAEFRAALRRFATPSLNHVWGDASGAIGWQPAGMTPRRRHDGLLPVRGDGRADVWDGFRPLEELPMRQDPPEGFLFSANEYNVPREHAATAAPFGHEWFEASRARRIREVLSGADAHDLAASQALQTDVVSGPGLRLKALAAALPETTETAVARALLAGWDGRMTVDSGAAALAEIWWTRTLKPALVAAAVSDTGLRPLFLPGDVEGMLSELEAPSATVLGPEPVATRDALLGRTLAEAAALAAKLMGPDPGGWRWGALHHGFFEHPLAAMDAGLSVGPLETPGSGSTVMHAAYRGSDFRVTHGASVRFVLDVGSWDASVCINAPGQSGDPESPHYADLARLWALGDYVPMLYGADAVDAATEALIVLEPAE